MKQLFHMVVLACAALASMASAGPTHQRPSPADVNTLRERAAFDLGCPESQLQLHQIDDRTSGVSGCGRQATYILMCDNNLYERSDDQTGCTWLVNAGGDQPNAPAPQAAPPAAPPSAQLPPPAPGAGTP